MLSSRFASIDFFCFGHEEKHCPPAIRSRVPSAFDKKGRLVGWPWRFPQRGAPLQARPQACGAAPGPNFLALGPREPGPACRHFPNWTLRAPAPPLGPPSLAPTAGWNLASLLPLGAGAKHTQPQWAANNATARLLRQFGGDRADPWYAADPRTAQLGYAVDVPYAAGAASHRGRGGPPSGGPTWFGTPLLRGFVLTPAETGAPLAALQQASRARPPTHPNPQPGLDLPLALDASLKRITRRRIRKNQGREVICRL